MLLAPDTAAAAQISRIDASEYQRPRRERGPGTTSRNGRRSVTSSGPSGPSFVSTAGIREDDTADTGTLMIIWLRHHNDHEPRVRTAIHPNPATHASPELAQALASRD
jgi:hypothetical protein